MHSIFKKSILNLNRQNEAKIRVKQGKFVVKDFDNFTFEQLKENGVIEKKKGDKLLCSAYFPFKDDAEFLIEGRYSELSDIFKRKIMNNSLDKENTYKILNPDKETIIKLIENKLENTPDYKKRKVAEETYEDLDYKVELYPPLNKQYD